MGNTKILSFKQVCEICYKLQKKGKRIVFCHGFFDILHRGHVTLLVEAKKLGDVLVVGVDHDDNAKILKGPNRPINDHESRMFVLANIEPVDIIFLIPSFKKVINQNLFLTEKIYKPLIPDLVVSCVQAGIFGNLKKKQAKEIGAKFVNIKNANYEKKTSKIVRIIESDI